VCKQVNKERARTLQFFSLSLSLASLFCQIKFRNWPFTFNPKISISSSLSLTKPTARSFSISYLNDALNLRWVYCFGQTTKQHSQIFLPNFVNFGYYDTTFWTLNMLDAREAVPNAINAMWIIMLRANFLWPGPRPLLSLLSSLAPHARTDGTEQIESRREVEQEWSSWTTTSGWSEQTTGKNSQVLLVYKEFRSS